MALTACTLFEGNYHIGVAALVNSLVANGYTGAVYAGYRGELPDWTSARKAHDMPGFPGASVLHAAPQVRLYFVPIETDRHLANYKAPFMRDILINTSPEEISGIYYFDPDVCVNTRWSYFEEWVECGIAVCEEGNSPFYEFHPRRVAWRKYCAKFGLELRFKFDMYINSGVVGVSRRYFSFLETWERVQLLIAPAIGGLDQINIQGGTSELMRDFLFEWCSTDQDALNAAIEADDAPCSVQNKSAMGGPNGLAIVPHAIGQFKPWKMNYLSLAVRGRPPRIVDKVFWQSLQKGPLQPLTPRELGKKIREVRAASLMAKVVRRG